MTLHFSLADCSDQSDHTWTFLQVTEPNYPPSAVFGARMRLDEQSTFVAERYPSSACNASLTSCSW